MTHYYEVDATNPSDPAKHFPTDARGNLYRAAEPGERYSVLTRQTQTEIALNGTSNEPDHHLYLAEPDTTQKGQYQDLERVDTAYESRTGPKDARVVETNVYVDQPIDDVLVQRQSDLNTQYETVWLQGYKMNGYVVKTEDRAMIDYNAIANGGWPDATVHTLWDPWGNVNKVTHEAIRGSIQKQPADPGYISKPASVVGRVVVYHRTAATGAYETHDDELVRLADVAKQSGSAADRQALIDYDITTGWPPAPTNPQATK